MLKQLKKTDSIENFVNEFNTNETFDSLTYISENQVLLFFFATFIIVSDTSFPLWRNLFF